MTSQWRLRGRKEVGGGWGGWKARGQNPRAGQEGQQCHRFCPRFLIIVGTSFCCGAAQTRTLKTEAGLPAEVQLVGKEPRRWARDRATDQSGHPRPRTPDQGAGAVPSRTPATLPAGMSCAQSKPESRGGHRPVISTAQTRSESQQPRTCLPDCAPRTLWEVSDIQGL